MRHRAMSVFLGSCVESLIGGPVAGSLPWLVRLLRTNAVRAHHLVIFMLNDVTVPYILSGRFELQPDAGDLCRVGDDGVFPPVFPGLRSDRGRPLFDMHSLAVVRYG